MITNKSLQSVGFDFQAAGSHGHSLASTDTYREAGATSGDKKNSNPAIDTLVFVEKYYQSEKKSPLLQSALPHNHVSKNDRHKHRTPVICSQSPHFITEVSAKLPQTHPDYHKPSALMIKNRADIPERVFMNGLMKHTVIALAIIVPLAAFSAYAAAPQVLPVPNTPAQAMVNTTTTEVLDIELSNIIYQSATVPTSVDSVNLQQYAGTWYEIGRLPLYFQRNCASDVTANYIGKDNRSNISVINKCTKENGSILTVDGIAKAVDATGSQLKVSFLPSWIRWLPVGRADYWVLARDAEYQTALVGTPDKDYLWLLARSPNISQQTYAKYRQIAQQQGYDLKAFQLTPHSAQSVRLAP